MVTTTDYATFVLEYSFPIIFGSAEVRTWDGWFSSTNASSVLCQKKFGETGTGRFFGKSSSVINLRKTTREEKKHWSDKVRQCQIFFPFSFLSGSFFKLAVEASFVIQLSDQTGFIFAKRNKRRREFQFFLGRRLFKELIIVL